MKVALIYPDFPDWDVGGCYYTGIASLAASLKEAGHDVFFWHVSSSIKKEAFIDRIRKYNPGVVGFSSTTPMYKYVREWVSWIKTATNALVICGGVHARMNPEDVISTPGIDVVCHGEGELSLVELCNKLDAKQSIVDIENFIFNTPNGVVQNALRLVEDLNKLPDPDRDIFDHNKLYDYSKAGYASTAAFVFSRGCPFSCSYCGNPRLMRDYPNKGKYCRRISPERAVQQIVNHLQKYPNTEYIRIHDSIINLNREWFDEFCDRYSRNIDVPYICLLRVDKKLFDEGVVLKLKQCGCVLAMLGIEHGNEGYRRSVLNRSMSDDEIISAFQLCKKHGLATRGYVMFGTPYETMDLMIDTVKLVAMSGAFDLSATIFYPFPQTQLHDLCLREGFVLKNTPSKSWPTAILDQPTVTKENVYFTWRISRILLLIYALCYRGDFGKNIEQKEEEIDAHVKSMINALSVHLNESVAGKLEKYDSLAHRLYKEIFHSEISLNPLLFRI